MTSNSQHLSPAEIDSEGYFKSIFDNALYGIATTIGTDFRFVRVNDAFCKLLEYDRDELVGVRSVRDVTHPGDYPNNENLLTRLINNEIQSFQIEKQYQTKSGRRVEVVVYVLGFYDHDGKYIGSTGSVMDITERNMMELELKASESKYRSLIDNSMVGVFSSTLNGRLTFVNDALARMYDFENPRQMMAQGPFSRCTDSKQHEKMLTMLLKDGSVSNFETEFTCHTGRHINVLLSAKLLADSLHGMVIDVTEIHKSRKDLEVSEANLVRAQEVAQIGSWDLDPYVNKLNWSDQNYKIFGIPKGTLVTNEKILACVYPEDRDYVKNKWYAAIAGEPYDIEYRLLVDNKIKWVQEKAEYVFDDNGCLESGHGITQEITETKVLLDKLNTRKKDLQQLAGRLLKIQEEERRRLARELHDDLSQRMAILSIETEKLISNKYSNEVVELAENIQQRLVSLSEDIHGISRQLHPSIIEDLGLVDALRSEINSFSKLEEITIAFSSDMSPEIQSLDVAVCLFRVTQESLRNIKKHAHASNVTIKLLQEDSSVILTISDDGRGFNPSIVRKKHGLGLKSMRERMRMVNGSISYISQEGQGTIVRATVNM